MSHKKWIGPAALASGVLLVVAACGSSPSAGGSSKSSTTLTFTSWGGSYQDAESKAFVEPYAKKTGIKILQDSPTDYAKLKTMVESGNVDWDVVDGDPFFANPNCGVLLDKINTSIVNESQFPKQLVSPCAVPIIQFSQVLMYNTKVYGNHPPTSWADFFDTKDFPGTRAIGNYPTYGALEAALLADGVAPKNLYPIDYNRAFKKLDTIKKETTFWTSGAQQEQMMESNSADMLIAWSGRAADAIKAGATYAPVWNQSILVYNVLMVPKGSKHETAAMKFIAYATSAKAQTRLPELISYSPVNLEAKPKLNAAGKSFLTSNPAISSIGVYQNMNWWGANLTKGTAKWTAWATG